MKIKNLTCVALLLTSSLMLCSCKAKQEDVFFETDTNDSFFTNVEETVNDKIDISQKVKLDSEFRVEYKTNEPDGIGVANFKAKSIKQIDMAGDVEAGEGKKLILVDIAVNGDSKNKGKPSTFNQVGDYPSPQFVLIDRDDNISYFEETYYSDAYTLDNKLFELSKITMDQEEWISTAIVFEIDSDKIADLAFRFTNSQGETEFYDIADSN